MRTAVCLAVLFVSDAPPTPAQQEAGTRFRNMDANRDGVITRDEWRASDRAFRLRDANGDGRITPEELRRGRRTDAGDDALGTSGEFTDWTPERFRSLDRDADDRLTRGEWPADGATFDRTDANRDGRLSIDEFLGFETAPPAVSRFDQMDRNRDGHVTIQEWGTDAQGFSRLDRDASGLLTREEVDADDAPADLFGSLDTNRDGRVSRDEWRWSAAAFDRRDADGNGTLSSGELAAAPEATSAAFRAGRERGVEDGRKAGREDKRLRNRWDLEGQRELERADAGYTSSIGDRADYQAGYREGFRLGYAGGFGPR